MSDAPEHDPAEAASKSSAKREGWVSLVSIVVTVFVIRFVLDIAFTLPRIAEWGVSLVAALLVGFAVRLVFKRMREIDAQ